MPSEARTARDELTLPDERGVAVVLTAILIVVLITCTSLALNACYSRLIFRELQAASDAAAQAAAVSVCATKACWTEAQGAAVTALQHATIHGRLGDSTTINLDPAGGPVWEDTTINFVVTIERGQWSRWLGPGVFTSLEPAADAQDQVSPQVLTNAVRVQILRPRLNFLAAPAGFSGSEYSVVASAIAVKGETAADCVAPFALPVCALVSGGQFSPDTLTTADRLFTSASRYGKTGSGAIVIPQFFYYPTNDTSSPPVVLAPPTSYAWNNPTFSDLGRAFGVVGLPDSGGQITEEHVRDVIDNTAHPCVTALIGQNFQVLGPGLTERQTDASLWRQISVAYSQTDPAHPPFSSVYANTTVAMRTHEDGTGQAPAGVPAAGACNSRRYVYNGTRGQTYFSQDRYASDFQPAGPVDGAVWPNVTPATPLWQVEIPIIAATDSITALQCPGDGAGGGPNVQVDANLDYEIVGFLKVNIFDTDIGWAPPLNPSLLPWTVAEGADVDRVWGFTSGQDVQPGQPDCYVAGHGTGADLNTTMCNPCNVVRGRVTGVTNYVAADQVKDQLVYISDAPQVNEESMSEEPPPAQPSPTPVPTMTPTPVGDGTFQARRIFATGVRPYAVAVADFNGDGKLDLVTADFNGDNNGYSVSVLLGNGDGTFQGPQEYGYSPLSMDLSVAVADLNGDGKLDLVTGSKWFSPDYVSVLLGNGDGTFQAPQTFFVGNWPGSVAVADFNGDGKPDVVTANMVGGMTSGTVSVLLGNGDGTLRASNAFATGLQPYSVAVGDFNGDGNADIATANYSGNSVSVLLGNGDGTFQPHQDFADPNTYRLPDSIAVGDFNGDGKLDLVTADYYSSTVSVLLGNGDGTFQFPRYFTTGSSPSSVAVADVNQDGKLDVVVTEYGGTVSVLLGNGDGTLQPRQAFAAGSGTKSVAVGDVNGDGVPDLVTADSGASTVSVLLGNVQTPP